MQKKVAIGLSGGVDSAVSAHLLKQQGHKITAVYLECWHTPGCRAEKDRQDALQIALQLKIPFKVLDFKKEYQNQVMTYFLEEYKQGRTPNPDILCNSVIKFGLFYDWAMSNGYDAIATGHYAQIGLDQEKKPVLLTSEDLHKDQTYFLHQMKQSQLGQIVFPIGHLKKDEVRTIAEQQKLSVADKKDSVGICFVGEINVPEFLKEKLGENPGEIVTSSGEIIGKHQGLWFYTIGQRKRFTVDTKLIKKNTNWVVESGDLLPLFVIGKDQKKNQLIIGPKISTFCSQWLIHSLHWIDKEINWKNLPLRVKIRHTGKILPCKLNQISNECWKVTTTEPVDGVSPGQFSVFYLELEAESNKQTKCFVCLGGGVISELSSS